MKELYFIRHGESHHNYIGKVAGHTDSPLTPKGKLQAQEAGKIAREKGLVFDVIISSPLQRAHHTAQAVAQAIGYPLEEIELLEELRERFFGEMEERTLEEYAITIEQYKQDPFAIDHIRDIEKITDLQYRANQLLAYLHELPHECVLLVSHGSFGRALKRTVKNAPITEYGEPIANAQLIRLL